MSLGPIMVDVEGLSLSPDERKLLENPGVGGVILFSRNYQDREQLRLLVDEIRSLRSLPLLVAVDHEGGRVQRFREGFTHLPPAAWFGQQYDSDEELGRRLAGLAGWIMAVELRDVGIDFSFAPVADLDRGLSEVIGDRAFHHHPDTVASLTLAWCEGMRRAGMGAVAKHFPGHGGVKEDSHLSVPVDRRTLEEVGDDLYPFDVLIQHHVPGIMMAHVRFPEIADRVASMSDVWIQQILRRQMGFNGAVFSDDVCMAGAEEAGGPVERSRACLAAGADVVLVCNDADAARAVLVDHPDPEPPLAAARLAAMRGSSDPERDHPGGPAWDKAVAALDDAASGLQPDLEGLA